MPTSWRARQRQTPRARADQSTVLQAARDLGLKLEVQKAASENDINTAFKGFARQRVGALLVTADPSSIAGARKWWHARQN